MIKQKNEVITNRVIPNLIWNLQRLPLLFLNYMRGRFRIKYKMTSLYKDEALNKDDFRATLRSGFTLIELLVVVLIIGILAAVALPQYQRAVAKSRLAEVLLVVRHLEQQMDLYVLEHGLPTGEAVPFTDMSMLELGGVTWNERGDRFTAPNYRGVNIHCLESGCELMIVDNGAANYTLLAVYNADNMSEPGVYKMNGHWTQGCYTGDTALGQYLCKSIESQGWGYNDEAY